MHYVARLLTSGIESLFTLVSTEPDGGVGIKKPLVQVSRLEPNICSSPDERVRFSARQNAVLRAVEAVDRLHHLVSKDDAIICPMLSPRTL